jgi:hypothetical protein
VADRVHLLRVIRYVLIVIRMCVGWREMYTYTDTFTYIPCSDMSYTYITYTDITHRDPYIHIHMYRGILKVCGTGPEFGTHWTLIWDAAGSRMLSCHSCSFILCHHDPTFEGGGGGGVLTEGLSTGCWHLLLGKRRGSCIRLPARSALLVDWYLTFASPWGSCVYMSICIPTYVPGIMQAYTSVWGVLLKGRC